MTNNKVKQRKKRKRSRRRKIEKRRRRQMTVTMSCYKSICQLWNRRRGVSRELMMDQIAAEVKALNAATLRTDATLRSVILVAKGQRTAGNVTMMTADTAENVTMMKDTFHEANIVVNISGSRPATEMLLSQSRLMLNENRDRVHRTVTNQKAMDL